MPDTMVSYEIYKYILDNYGPEYVDTDGEDYWICLDSLISTFPGDFIQYDNGNVYTISQNVSQKGIFIGTLP